MDGNREEANRCQQLAIETYRKNDVAKAIQLIKKSQRMSPCKENEVLLEIFQSGAPLPPQSAQQPSSSTTSSATPPSSSDPTSISNQEDSSATYTDEQNSLCRRILKLSNYYEVLGISQDASDEVIKKAYKKLALQLHPDKNKAPTAEEAFKKVSEIFQCLCDKNKRHIYDTYGEEGLDRSGSSQRRVFVEEMNAEDIIRNFVREAFYYGDHGQRRRHATRRGERDTHFHFQNLVQFFFIAILILVPLLSNMLRKSDEILYTLHSLNGFPVHLKTPTHHISYFVQQDFDQQLKRNSITLRQIEFRVEFQHFQEECEKEQKETREKVMAARYYGLKDELARLASDRGPKCDIYLHLKMQRYYLN